MISIGLGRAVNNDSQRGFRVLGIDPGSRRTGFACLIARKRLPLTARDFAVSGLGVINLRGKDWYDDRLHVLASSVRTIVDEFKPDAACIETPFCGINARSTIILGEVRGVILACLPPGVRMMQITPAEVKRKIVGHGSADKTAISMAVTSLFGITKHDWPSDATDALAIALCAGLSLGVESAAAGVAV